VSLKQQWLNSGFKDSVNTLFMKYYVLLMVLIAATMFSCSDNKVKVRVSDNEYTFMLKNNSFNNDTPIDGVKVVQLGKYIYALQGWNPNFVPKVKPYIFKWRADGLDATPVKEEGPWQGRHATPSFVSGDTICVAGSDFQLAAKQLDAWIAYANDTGKLTWIQTNTFCKGCSQSLMDGALNPADQCFYYGGGQLTFDYTDGVVDTLWKTCDFFRTSEYVGSFKPLEGNVAGTMTFLEGDKLHIIGGGLYHRTKPELRTFKKSHYVIDVKEKTVMQLDDYPGKPVMYPSLTVVDSKLFLYGGSDGENSSNLYYYDTSGVWTAIANSTLPQTHAAGFTGFKDSLGKWHLVKVAGNFTNDVYQVNFPEDEDMSGSSINDDTKDSTGNM
jgi:hypothetical protein